MSVKAKHFRHLHVIDVAVWAFKCALIEHHVLASSTDPLSITLPSSPWFNGSWNLINGNPSYLTTTHNVSSTWVFSSLWIELLVGSITAQYVRHPQTNFKLSLWSYLKACQHSLLQYIYIAGDSILKWCSIMIVHCVQSLCFYKDYLVCYGFFLLPHYSTVYIFDA